jgi:hypothetical protein
VIKLAHFLFLPPVFTLAAKMASREVKVIAMSCIMQNPVTPLCYRDTPKRFFRFLSFDVAFVR